MTDQPQQINHGVLDPDAIQMDVTDIGLNGRRLSFELSARDIKRAQKKLKKSNQPVNDKQLAERLQRECLESGMKQLDPNCIWGPHLPEGDSIPTVRKDKPMAFAVLIDDMPPIDWPDWAELTIARPVQEITSDMLDMEMNEQCLLAGTTRPRQGHAEPGDTIRCNLQLDIEGSDQSFQTQEITLRIPQPGQPIIIEGMPVPGFESHLSDVSVDETVTIDFRIPDNHPVPTLRSQTATVALEILEINELIPASVDEVVAQYGSPSEKALRNQISSALQAKANRDQRFAMITQLFDQLVERLVFDVPQHVLDTKLARRINQERREAHGTAVSESELEARIESHRDEWMAEVEDKSRTQAISVQLTRHLHIGISEDLINKQISEMALDLGRRPEDFRKQIIDEGKINFFANLVRQAECLNHLEPMLTIKDVPADEWSRQQGEA